MKKLLVVALLAFCCGGLVLYAQTQFGTVSGQVTDQSNSAVPNAKVVLTNTATGLSQTVNANQEGSYTFTNLPAASYEITVEATGFRKYVEKFTLGVAQRASLNAQLEVGSISETLVVEGTAVAVNTTTGDISSTINNQDIKYLPILNRNPYNLIATLPASAETGSLTGDTRGVGVSVGGARTGSISFMLDGGENNETFGAGVGQSVPQDAIEEFRVQTNNTTAEFGRNAVVANVVTKSGTNNMHGSLYEFYRGAALSSKGFDDNANGTPKSNFVRNQYGGSIGGPIVKGKTFYFGSYEGIKVRSSATKRYYVPTQQFMDAAASNAVEFIKGFGSVPQGDSSQVITAQQIVEDAEGGVYADTPLINHNTGQPLAANTPLFARFSMKAPIDAGGGDQQDTHLATVRFDHSFSPTAQFFGRFALQDSKYPVGSNSISPWAAFNTGWGRRSQNYAFTLTNSFSPKLFSEGRVVYNRINENQPLGEAPGTAACWSYDLLTSTPTGDPIVFPGYLPDSCFGFAIPYGGPQNVYQFYDGMTFMKGKNTFKWGVQFVHIRDNKSFGAFETGYYDVFTMQGMLDGLVDYMYVGIDPKGKFPGDYYNLATDGPLGPPNFTRHYRYNELATYFEDSIKINNRLNLTLGLRWEYFGVLHSPNKERYLDANLYLSAVGSPDSTRSIYEQVRDARFSRTTNFYNQDFTNFAPRFGFAYDLLGNKRTVLRGGYGLFYDRNFGNALFNTIQNFPNYATIAQVPAGSFGGPQVPIEVNQFDSLNALMEGGSFRLTGSARMLDRQMKTAYSAQWNLTLEHDITGKGVIATASYLGANGYHLYALNNLNQMGSCVLAPGINPGCNETSTGSAGRLNQTGLTGMNRRGNEGLSRYNAMTLGINAQRLASSGLNLSGNYTWSHSIDNSSSFFGDAAFEYYFGFGFRDPYNPSLDRASSTNDIRHRFSFTGQWNVPFAKNMTGIGRQVFDGWILSTILSAQTGAAFTVYDGSNNSMCNNSGTNFCYPVPIGAVPEMTQAEGDSPNAYVLYGNLENTFLTQEEYCNGDLACTTRLYNLESTKLSARNMFRTPGVWNFDVAIVKEFTLPKEGMKLRLNVDFLNAFNHANLYGYPGTNIFTGAGSQVLARRGVLGDDTRERRNIQMALHLEF